MSKEKIPGNKDKIGAAQAAKEVTLPDAATRVWKTERFPQEVGIALEKNVPKKILVIGCGVDETASYADLFPTANFVGVDFHPGVITAARDLYPRENVTYLQGDMLNSKFVNSLEPESFGAVVLTGVLTNLVHEDDVVKMFQGINRLLAYEGRIIISDYLLNEPTQKGSSWEQRYMRDLLALKLAGFYSQDVSIPPYGTIITKPEVDGKKLSALDAFGLSPEEMKGILAAGKYERLARHWDPVHLMLHIAEGSNGDVRVKEARIEQKRYDEDSNLQDLADLTAMRLVLGKKRADQKRSIEVEQIIIKMDANKANGSFSQFFEELTEE